MSEYNKRIREERKRLGMTQVKVADLTGVSSKTQGAYENGRRAPDIKYLEALEAAGFDLGYIVSGQRKPDPKLEKSNPANKGMDIAILVLNVIADLGVSPGKEGTKQICQYVYQNCPTEQGIKEYIKSVYAIKGIDLEAEKRKDEQEFLDNMIEDTPVDEDELKDFDPMDSLWLGGDKNDKKMD